MAGDHDAGYNFWKTKDDANQFVLDKYDLEDVITFILDDRISLCGLKLELRIALPISRIYDSMKQGFV